MGATGEVDDERGGRLLGDPGAEFPRPAAEDGEELRLGLGTPGAGEKRGAHGVRIAQGLAPREPRRTGGRRERGEDLHAAPVVHHGQGRAEGVTLEAQEPLGAQTREPEREDTAVGHRRWQPKYSTYVLISGGSAGSRVIMHFPSEGLRCGTLLSFGFNVS